jgi:DNA-binding NarL/FixJ family response regulator
MITVVLADDHAMVRDGLKALLEAGGDIQVVGVAADGRAAVDVVRTVKPRVAVVDVTMPGLGGIDVTAQLAKVCPSTAVVILSMHSAVEHVTHAIRAGARGYVLKESAGAEVVEAVRLAAAGERYFSRKVADAMAEQLASGRESAGETGLSLLSPREREILLLVVEGKSSATIGTLLSISPKTVDTYRSRCMQKLGIDNLPDLIKFAIRHELIDLG